HARIGRPVLFGHGSSSPAIGPTVRRAHAVDVRYGNTIANYDGTKPWAAAVPVAAPPGAGPADPGQFLAAGYAGTTMKAVAAAAGVSVPTVEAAFGTKARLLKAAIDVATAGDDAPVAMLDRAWAVRAEAGPEPA